MNKDKLFEMRPDFYMDGLKKLIEYVNSKSPTKAMEMIEIGSYAGESSELFAQKFKNVICIDPYIDDYDVNDITCSFAPMSEVRKVFEERISIYNNISLIPLLSDDAINTLEEGKKFDLVYIDGMHTYDQIKKDITNYLPIINEGGFIAGHDFHPVYQGIIDGVRELLGEPDAIFQDSSWIKRI
jgi:predicted O-methyltransferase YrrM